MLNDFTSFIMKSKKADPVLPLMHTTDGYGFRKIIRKGRLEPNECTVFKGEFLSYLFYGRPAYKLNSDGKAASQAMHFPVCFLIKSNFVKIAKRVFPFDSGAFGGKLFDSSVHGKMELSNFLIDPDPAKPGKIPTPEIPARLIGTFFDTNKGYYDQLPKKDVEIDPMNFEAEAFYELISSKQKSEADTRRATIEIQIEDEIELSSDSVEAIVIPRAFLSSNEVKNAFKNLDALPLDYGQYHGIPAEFTMAIHMKVKEYLKAQKLYV